MEMGPQSSNEPQWLVVKEVNPIDELLVNEVNHFSFEGRWKSLNDGFIVSSISTQIKSIESTAITMCLSN